MYSQRQKWLRPGSLGSEQSVAYCAYRALGQLSWALSRGTMRGCSFTSLGWKVKRYRYSGPSAECACLCLCLSRCAARAPCGHAAHALLLFALRTPDIRSDDQRRGVARRGVTQLAEQARSDLQYRRTGGDASTVREKEQKGYHACTVPGRLVCAAGCWARQCGALASTS